ncbi:MarR family transcriptional regulator [Pseudomonas sp. JS3066]|uniref:MarR family winged helix-turn-helix transcriptional regulator n=1 Tax=unclassified Pseudomonas TaxID=196821 RepID=UPI000EA93151|nr:MULTISPECIES: MarR family transcriptional regulator [unclassified Pseudomonas]AYF90804.1 MarR family transcriptional regulator [Pseudomonas sp. DY-1]MDH4656906.1 MarR family transcriptional regulator [Pseudomonas sp. BN606]MRK22163.1 MarR family transcriptional regulator [Pseudomonas sp. JG-B]WVK95288.1 MarR family transcriptional regulator [Pseudomonas sp. JS3066]
MSVGALQLQVSSRMVISGRNWRRICQANLSKFGISEACCGPLLMIGRLGGGVRQVQLAQAIGIEGPSLVRLLDQLCNAGLIERQEDASDRRAKTLSVTSAGRELSERLENELILLRRQALAQLSPADLQAALRVFDAFDQFSQAH